MKKLTLLFLIASLCVVYYKKFLVLGMIFFGSIFFPEASQILKHYCFGDGTKLILESDYIKKSPVVLKNLKNMQVGEKKRVTLKQYQDWRLSYALNPFFLEKRKGKVIITQWIAFDKTDRDYTYFGPFKISDNIVHTFECTPFEVYYEFEL